MISHHERGWFNFRFKGVFYFLMPFLSEGERFVLYQAFLDTKNLDIKNCILYKNNPIAIITKNGIKYLKP